MKKIITLLFLFSFCQAAMSQDHLREVYEKSSIEDLKTLKTIVVVKAEQEQPILDFFYKKYKQYSISSISSARKQEIALGFEQELKNLIDPFEAVVLEKNKKILKKLVSE